jgi:hypothetical protein
MSASGAPAATERENVDVNKSPQSSGTHELRLSNFHDIVAADAAAVTARLPICLDENVTLTRNLVLNASLWTGCGGIVTLGGNSLSLNFDADPQQVAFNSADTGLLVFRNKPDIWVAWFGADSSAHRDSTAAFSRALAAASHLPGVGQPIQGTARPQRGNVRTTSGAYLVCHLGIPDNIRLQGSGIYNTTIMNAPGCNRDEIYPLGNGIADLNDIYFDGNFDQNPTAGGFYWNVNSSVSGIIEPFVQWTNIYIANMNLVTTWTSGPAPAFVVLRGPGYILTNVNLYADSCNPSGNTHICPPGSNYAAGLYWDGSDIVWSNSFFQALGNQSPTFGGHGVLLKGTSSKFIGNYFSGNLGADQVTLYGTSGLQFLNDYNDNAWHNCWALYYNVGAGLGNYGNQWIGGGTSHCGGAATNTYAAFRFDDYSYANRITNHYFNGDQRPPATGIYAAYAVQELGSHSDYNIVESGTVVNDRYTTPPGTVTSFFASGVATLAGMHSSVNNVAGYNPLGAAAITVQGSPFTYTNADHVREDIFITGGTVSSVTKNSVTLCAASPCFVNLPPGEQLTVTYSAAPTMTKNRN